MQIEDTTFVLASPLGLELPDLLRGEPAGRALRPESGHDDQELIDGLKSGDEAGFTAFYERFAGILLNVTWSILRDSKEAEDALQEAFVQMWKQAATYDPARGGLFTWAVTITRSKAIDGFRRNRRRQLKTEKAVAEASTAPFRDVDLPGSRMMPREEGQQMRVSLGSLVPSQPQALPLALFSAITPARPAPPVPPVRRLSAG